MNKYLVLLSLFTITGLSFVPCASAAEVHLSIAASLKEVINDLADGFAKGNPGVKFRKNFGASGALAKQIDNGAPADIFIPANQEWMEYLKDKGRIATGSIRPFAYNTLVFAGRPAAKVGAMSDLPRLGKIAIGSPRSVPAGEYATEAINRAGLGKLLEQKLVMARDVRDCLRYAERGEVEGAFVYRTDLLQAREAKVLFVVPQKLYPEVVYPMALTLTGARNREAAAFFSYLQGDAARGILKEHGFVLK